jgi:DNA-directed RNA polymerase subunit F
MVERMDDFEKALQDHEKRISALEKAIFEKKVKPKKKQEFKGLSGGIEYLRSRGFLDAPKSTKEVHEELAREGYHYGDKSVDKLLRVDFTTNKKILTRIKENDVWKYVIRK